MLPLAQSGSYFTLALQWLQFQGKRSRSIDHLCNLCPKPYPASVFSIVLEKKKDEGQSKGRSLWKVTLAYFLFLLWWFVWSDLYFSKMCSVKMGVQWPWTEFLSQQSRSNQSHICSLHPHVYPKRNFLGSLMLSPSRWSFKNEINIILVKPYIK